MNAEQYRNEVDAVRWSPDFEARTLARLRRETAKPGRRGRPAVKLLLAAVLTALAVTTLAAGTVRLATGYGGNFTMGTGRDEDGNPTRWAHLETPGEPGFVEVRDSRVWFTASGEETDVTDEITPEHAYLYLYTDGEGVTHVLAVGGPADNPGWAEFLQNREGRWMECWFYDAATGSSGLASYDAPEEGEVPPPPPEGPSHGPVWYQNAKAELGLPW